MDTFCPNGHRVQVSGIDIGSEARCPVCQQVFLVKMMAQESASAPSNASPSPTGASPVDTSPADDRRKPWWGFDVLNQMRPMTQLFLLLGLVLTLFTRGWDGVGDRRVMGAKSQVQNAITHWNDQWEDRLDRISEEERSIRTKENLTAEDRERLDRLRSDYLKVQQEREADRQQQTARWNDLERNAREAESQNQMAKPWREGFFVFGTILFSVGLITVGFTSDGGVRWFCLALLAIIVCSIYFGADTGLKPGRPVGSSGYPQAT